MDRPYLLSLFVAVLVAASLFAFWRLSGRGGPRLRYQQIRPLRPPEQALYWRLVEALPECVILSQVTFIFSRRRTVS